MSINRNYFKAIGRRVYVAIKKFRARHARRWRPRFIVRGYADNNSRELPNRANGRVGASLDFSCRVHEAHSRERKKIQLKQLEHDPFHM
uniref:Uncharacterized protein n=1 Tax=Trichogramma kaykai TaxID=54128 RepID=A0ABD2W754_9HYME